MSKKERKIKKEFSRREEKGKGNDGRREIDK